MEFGTGHLFWFCGQIGEIRFGWGAIQPHSGIEFASSIQIPHGFVIGSRHYSRHLFRRRVCVVEDVRCIFIATGRIAGLGDNDNFHVIHFRVDDVRCHFDERRDWYGSMETDVRNVFQSRSTFSVQQMKRFRLVVCDCKDREASVDIRELIAKGPTDFEGMTH